MKILVACEFSGIVREAFRKRGHESWSCDLLPTEIAGNHYQGDIFDIIYEDWALIIAHPPCTYLSTAGNRWFNVSRYGDKARQRIIDRESAVSFFMKIANAPAEKIAIENPIGTMSTRWRKPNQIVHPYYFGDSERKATCLWLKGLEPLKYSLNDQVEPVIIEYKNGKGTDSNWHMKTLSLPSELRRHERSRTYLGIANAMAEQWG